MTLIFCAFGAEFAPLRARLRTPRPLAIAGLRGALGRLAGSEVAVIVSGVGVKRAQQTAARAFDAMPQIKRVIITGIAGGLHADLRVGDLVVVDRLWTRRADEFAHEHELPIIGAEGASAALRRAGIVHHRGALITSRTVLLEAAHKQRMHQALGALAVDMESAIIAREAHGRGLPFICLRTILDTAEQDLDAAILADENGRVRPLRAAAALARHPRLFRESLRLMRNLRIATQAMAAAVEVVVQPA